MLPTRKADIEASVLLAHGPELWKETPEKNADRLTFLDVVFMLLAGWRRLLVGGLLGLCTGLFLALLLPVEFTALTRVLPPQPDTPSSALLAGTLGGLAGVGGGGLNAALGLKNSSDYYMGLLKSRSVADPLIARFDLRRVYQAPDVTGTRKELARRTNLLTEKEGLIAISVTDRDRQRAAALANAYVEALNRRNASLAFNVAAQRRRFFEAQLGAEKTALAEAEFELKQNEEANGLVQLNGQASLLLQSVAQVRAQIAGLNVELQALAGSETPDNPQYQQIRARIAALQSQLSELEGGRKVSRGGDAAALATASAPAVGLAYVRRAREVKYHEALLELLARQYTAAQLDEARTSPEVQVVDRAEPPDRRSSPHRGLLLLGLSLLGLLAGSAWIVGAELLALPNERRDQQMNRIGGLFRRGPACRA